MKKITSRILILIYIIYLFINTSFADTKPECKINDTSPKVIKNYLKNTRKIINKLNSEIAKNHTNKQNSWQKWKNQWISEWSHLSNKALWLFNSLTSWNDYTLEFDYRLYDPIFNNIPFQINRDVKQLSNQNNQLENLISILTKKWYLDTQLNSNICQWIPNCNLSWEAWQIIISIIQSTKNIKTLIEQWATHNKKNINLCKKVLFINNQDCNNIYKIYYDAKNECQDTWTWDKIKKSAENFKLSSNSTKEWIEAWNLLTWNSNSTEYQELEKKLLRQELSRQWLSWNQAKQIMNNLKTYNNKNSPLSGHWFFNHPLESIAKTISNAIDPDQKKELMAFKKSISDAFSKKSASTISINDLIVKTNKNKKESINNYNIQKIYLEQLPIAQAQDLDTNQITREVLQMNNDLSIWINTLNNIIPFSHKTCNAQWQWQWLCN